MFFSNQDLVYLLKDRKNLIGVEIGVERGNSAFHFLSNCNIELLYLIDPYESYIDSDTNHVCDEFCQKQNKETCLNLLKNFTNFKLIEKKSDDAVNQFDDNSLDFIFIDGLHSYEQCLKDIKNYYPKLKQGGLFSGHDFSYAIGCNKAVLEFSNIQNKNVLTCKNDVWYWFK